MNINKIIDYTNKQNFYWQLASSPAINFRNETANKRKLRPGTWYGIYLYCMGNCAHALAMKTRGLATDCRYRAVQGLLCTALL